MQQPQTSLALCQIEIEILCGPGPQFQLNLNSEPQHCDWSSKAQVPEEDTCSNPPTVPTSCVAPLVWALLMTTCAGELIKN